MAVWTTVAHPGLENRGVRSSSTPSEPAGRHPATPGEGARGDLGLRRRSFALIDLTVHALRAVGVFLWALYTWRSHSEQALVQNVPQDA